MVKTKNVLVVGAGPGGVSSAYFITYFDKENIFNVDLIERLPKNKYQRYHEMCGEGISSDLLSDISPLKPKGLVERIHSVFDYYPGDIQIKTCTEGYVIDRPIFFNSIINEFKKNGGFFSNKRFISYKMKEKKIKVKINDSYKEYDYIVVADGPNSLFQKTLQLHVRKRLLRQYIIDKQPEHGQLKFFYDEKYHGDYYWEFPHHGQIKIGYPAESTPHCKINKNKIVEKHSKYICYGGLPHYSYGNILLVGDAAGQTNPLTKGGIRPAMVAGKIAADAIVKQDPSLYDKNWKATDFTSNLFLQAFEKYQTMDNDEIKHHMKPFTKDSVILQYLSILLFYRKYLDLYRAYDLSNKVGW